MKDYRVIEEQTGLVSAVKIGWSWPGFLLTWIWALTKKLWLISTIIILINILLLSIEAQTLLGIKSIIVCVLFGALGNSWVENRLTSKPHTLTKLIKAENKDEAVLKYNEWEKAEGSSSSNSPDIDLANVETISKVEVPQKNRIICPYCKNKTYIDVGPEDFEKTKCPSCGKIINQKNIEFE